MRPFKFDLQAVLDQRRAAEDAAQGELARLLREQMVLQTQRRALRDMVEDDRKRLERSLAGVVNVARVQRHASYTSQAGARSSQIDARLGELGLRTELARHRYFEAARRRKAIERLREKQRRGWVHVQGRRQAVEAEDHLAHFGLMQLAALV